MTTRVFVAAAAAGLMVISVSATSAGAASTGKSFTVTAAVSKDSITLGGAVRITGTVTPTYAGQKVHLKHLIGTKWKTVATHAVKRGKYRFRTAPTRAGTWAYRVATDAHRARSGAHSPTVRVGVYRWHNVADLTPVTGGWETGGAEINGTKYPHSLVDTSGSGPVEYNLGGKCSRLIGVAGLQDDSTPGDTYDFEIDGDYGSINAVLFLEHIKYDQVEPFSFSVTGVPAVTFSDTPDSPSGPDYPAYGTPMVLCRF